MPASMHVFEAGWREVDRTSGAPGAVRRSPYECHPSRVHMRMRRHVATEKGIAEGNSRSSYRLAIRVLLSNY